MFRPIRRTAGISNAALKTRQVSPSQIGTMQKLTFSLPTIQKPSKEVLRRWLIALAIAAILACCLWALWSVGSASASASDAPAFHPAQGAGDPPPVPDRHNPTGHGPSLHLANNTGLEHLPYLGEIHGAGPGDGAWFIPPSDIHPLNTLPVGDDGFSFPGGGNWHDFGNQSMGLGISGPGGGNGQSGPQDNTPSADDPTDPSDPSNKDVPGPGPTDPPGNPPGELTSGVPEPATWAMFLIGFGTIGWTLRAARRGATTTA
jgi:hypothetical protein